MDLNGAFYRRCMAGVSVLFVVSVIGGPALLSYLAFGWGAVAVYFLTLVVVERIGRIVEWAEGR